MDGVAHIRPNHLEKHNGIKVQGSPRPHRMRSGCCERLRCYYVASIHLVIEEAKFVLLEPTAEGLMDTVPNDENRYDLGRPTDDFRMNRWNQEEGGS